MLPSLAAMHFRKQQQPQHVAPRCFPFRQNPLHPPFVLLMESQEQTNHQVLLAMAVEAAQKLQQQAHESEQLFPLKSSNETDQEEEDEETEEGVHQDISHHDSANYSESRFNSNRSNHEVSRVEDTDDCVSGKTAKHDARWLVSYEELKAYKEQFGDCIVPRGYMSNTRLANWVAEQRKQYKLFSSGKPSSITPDRIAILNELDFAWNAQEAAWDRHLGDLRRFRTKYGHCLVPLTHPEFPKLGLWVKEQRRHRSLMNQSKVSHMTPERVAKLDGVGFCWDTHEAAWLERLRELSDFKVKYGHCTVPTNHLENPKLATWVHHQRRQYKLFQDGKPTHITENRIKALNDLEFVWCPRGQYSTNSQTKGNSDDDESSASEAEADHASLNLRPRKRKKIE